MPKSPLRGFRRAVHDDAAGGVEPVDLDIAVAALCRLNKRPSAAAVSSVRSACVTWTLPANIARSARSCTSIRSAVTSTGALLLWPLSADTGCSCLTCASAAVAVIAATKAGARMMPA